MSDLQQQIWDYVYDLLSEDEAAAVRELICSDPDAARTYSRVMLQTEVVAEASRLEGPASSWRTPKDAASDDEQTAAISDRSGKRSRLRTMTSWFMATAAAGLVCVMFSPWFTLNQRDQQPATAAVAAPLHPVHITVAGPATLNPEVSNTFAVRTTTVAGKPLETDVAYRLYDAADELALAENARTDASGNASLRLPASLVDKVTRLEIASANTNDFWSRPLEVSDTAQATYLRIDKPMCRPGESLNYRSLTLSRFGLRVDAESDIRYFVTDPTGKEIESSVHSVTTDQGVADGKFVIPDDAVDGSYAVVAQSPNRKFPEEWREFAVRRYHTPRFKKTLELAKDSYTEGDTVEADFNVRYADGTALADALVKIRTTFDDKTQSLPDVKTDAKGVAKLTIPLPEKVAAARGVVSVTVEDKEGVAETISEDVRINLGKVNVEFYPEGGQLVAGLVNRVYFYGRDPLGKPAHLEGRIVDSSDNGIVDVSTIHEGRGLFAITPNADAQYWFEIEKPDGVTKRIELPAVATNEFMTIQTGLSVFAASEPIALDINTTRASTPLVIAGYCRGAMVGQLNVDATDYDVSDLGSGTFRAELPLATEAQGVIRVTAFDRSYSPVKPIAERLVYRRVSRQLKVQLSEHPDKYEAGSRVAMQLTVMDEHDVPQAAVAGVSLVDDSILTLGKDKSTRMPTYFHLLTDIENPQDLEDANFYLSEREGAEQALDLLLGTQGWRRFVEVPVEQMAEASVDSPRYLSTFSEPLGRGQLQQLFRDVSFDLPFVEEHQSEQIALAAQPVQAPARRNMKMPFFIGATLLVGGPALLLVTVVGFARVGVSRRFAVPCCAVAVAALIVGFVGTRPDLKVVADTAIDSAAIVSGTRSVPEEEDATLEAFAAGMEFPNTVANKVPQPGVAGDTSQSPEPAVEKTLDAVPAVRFQSTKKKDSEPSKSSPEAPAEPPTEAASGATPAPLASAEGEKRDASPPRFADDTLMRRMSKSQMDALYSTSRRRLARQYPGQFQFAEDKDGGSDERPELSPTLYWQPRMVIDASGQAEFSFTLPKKATTFRAIIEAHGAERLGATEAVIVSQAAD